MDMNKSFSEFNVKIKLDKPKIQKLKKNRQALRDKIRKYFKEKEWGPTKFYSQGSFPLNTNLNPIKKKINGDVKEEYDLDDGIYFICKESERKAASTYHERIKDAVEGHAESVEDKNTCVRVIYSDGHHIDLPSYWLEKNGDTPKLAHKSDGFIYSDPKAFKDWVDNKISSSESNGQLRRIIRYLKAWKDHRQTANSSLILPSGFILTILACNNYSKNIRDDLAFKETIENILKAVELNFECNRPTVPKDEDLLSKYSEDSVLNEIKVLKKYAVTAIDADCVDKALKSWQKVFGDRFPNCDDDKYSESNSSISDNKKTKVNKPWLSKY